MGIYLFKREVLLDLLADPQATDFGRDVFPKNYQHLNVYAHLFDGYWEDLGTIKSYHESALDLAREKPPFEFYHPDGPIYTRMRFLPAARISGASQGQPDLRRLRGAIRRRRIHHSLLGVRSRIGERCRILETVIIGADRFETDEERERNRRDGLPNMNVGSDCHIERAILDKDCRVGNHVTINYRGKEHERGRRLLLHPRRDRGDPEGDGGAGWESDLGRVRRGDKPHDDVNIVRLTPRRSPFLLWSCRRRQLLRRIRQQPIEHCLRLQVVAQRRQRLGILQPHLAVVSIDLERRSEGAATLVAVAEEAEQQAETTH